MSHRQSDGVWSAGGDVGVRLRLRAAELGYLQAAVGINDTALAETGARAT